MNTKPILHAPVVLRLVICALIFGNCLPLSFAAQTVPPNLVNGLDKIVENRLIELGKITALPTVNAGRLAGQVRGKANPAAFTAYKAAVAKEANHIAASALTDSVTGKYLVEVMPNGLVPVGTLQANLQSAFPQISVTATDTRYAGHGLIEGYVVIDDVAAIAKSPGVGSVILQLRPIHSVGAVTEFGVNQHRVNRVSTIYNAAALKNLDGTGLSIGVMSDSYNSQPSMEGGYTTAQQDVLTGDLPGTGNMVNAQPVVVLQDFSSPPNATNEGRAMCQIVHDMAPKARIGFATADVGELGFANNIRALGGLINFTYPGQDFNGDVVCDDVSYIDEPMFQDGIVAQGVIDVVNAGKVYCSSAANNAGVDGYLGTFRPVPNNATSLASSNIKLNTVPANLQNLYAGGFHNFNPTGGPIDVAQTINTASDAGAFIFQWNDPFDSTAPTLIDPPIYTGSGTSVLGSSMDFGPFTFTGGHSYVIQVKSTPATPADNFDAIVSIIDSNGNLLVDQDTGTDEVVTFFSPATDNYTVRVHPFGASPPVYTQGSYSVQVNAATAVSGITQDFNLLFFDTAGNFISALGINAFITNRPYELTVPTFNADGFSQVQMVIARSNLTAPANAATQLKYVFFGNGVSGVGPAEYGDILTPVTYGHSAVAGAQSVAAYSGFRPNIPEDFTSPGPVVIYFDVNNNRLATPQFRQKPDVAAMDASNNTFFPLGPIPAVTESTFDMDTNYPNFSGTSAASPHAAALSALLLQQFNKALTPAQVKTLFQLTAFPHDLDPFVATGTASSSNGGKVDITVRSDNDRNVGTAGSTNPNTFAVSYTGAGRLATLRFNPDADAPAPSAQGSLTGGNTTGGNFTGNATGNMPGDFLTGTYNFTPGMVWLTSAASYAFGSSVGLVAGDVTHTYSNPAPFPSNPSPGNTGQHQWSLNFTFPGSPGGKNDFSTGKVFRFNNARSPWQDATTPQGMTVSALVRDGDFSADLLGSGVLIPEYGDHPIIGQGMTYNGTVVDGTTTYPFSGRLTNSIGRGYSTLDGYGFINLEAAAAATLPVAGVASRKNHAGVDYDIALPATGPAGIECRAPGANNSYTLIYSFARPVASSGTASITSGVAAISPGSDTATASRGPNSNEVRVELTGVPNAQHLIVTLNGVTDGDGNTFASVPARMDVLIGDVNSSTRADAGDVIAVRLKTITSADATNFRNDVDLSGRIDAGDINLVRQSIVNALP